MDKYNPEVNADFPAKAYLKDFTDPRDDPRHTQEYFLKGFHSFYEKYINGSKGSKSLFEFGGGPSLFSLISAAKHVDSITFSEYAETNRNEIRQWKDEESEREFSVITCQTVHRAIWGGGGSMEGGYGGPP